MKPQIATNPIQSDRLIACGVDEATADMSWREIVDIATEELVTVKLDVMPYEDAKVIYGERGITPAWSLSALCSFLYNRKMLMVWAYAFQDRTNFDNYIETLPGLFRDPNCLCKDPIESCVQAIEFLAAEGYKVINYDNAQHPA